jgi:hypothetical protein
LPGLSKFNLAQAHRGVKEGEMGIRFVHRYGRGPK